MKVFPEHTEKLQFSKKMKREIKDQSHQLREELKQLRSDVQRRNAQYGLDISLIESKAEHTKKKLDVALHKERSFLALQLYLPAIRNSRKTTEANPIPPFLLAMEAELLRHLHQMCILRTQLLLLDRQSEKNIKTRRQYLVKVTEESFKTEIQLLSDICYLERERSDSEESFIQKLHDSQDELSLFQSDNESVLNAQAELYKSIDSPISSILASINTILSSSGTTTKPKTTRRREVQTPKNKPHWKVPFAFSFGTIEKSKAGKQKPKENKKTLLENIVTTKHIHPEKSNYYMASSYDAQCHIVQV